MNSVNHLLIAALVAMLTPALAVAEDQQAVIAAWVQYTADGVEADGHSQPER